ncbi:hypothetical protein F8E02_05085 [Methanoculleus sp. Wushi-C6]|uniref:Uncharacterized protein n=1 Tax=Methanoculleus caldifontis TaxID=2651577 RepID=A0ABU3X018_9EURY|nr:hypothetical protein [Methanoculleus sp. Wushi-C6]MDV2481390.1 hypothetical protein [Methanoculleus sp. Wushi-C6]
MQEAETTTAYQQHSGAPQAKQAMTVPGAPGEQQRVALGILRRMLVEFHREWTELRTRETDGAWVIAANALLERYSHRIYDVIRDLEAVVGDDLAVDIRCLSADMIMTTNILVMTCRGEDCCRRGDALAGAALRHAERCRTLRVAVRGP